MIWFSVNQFGWQNFSFCQIWNNFGKQSGFPEVGEGFSRTLQLALFCVHHRPWHFSFSSLPQMSQSYSPTPAWRRKKRRKTKRSMKKAPALKSRPIRTGSSQAPAHQTPMPRTTAASCSLYQWPLVSSFLPSSACAGCEGRDCKASGRPEGRSWTKRGGSFGFS